MAAGSICGFRAAKSPGRERIAFPPGAFDLIQNATFMNSATQHRITASGT